MRTIQILLVISAALSIFATQSCKNKDAKDNNKNSDNTVEVANYDYEGDKLDVTNKIMYDVVIVNEIIGDRTKNSPDWFWENLPQPESDTFLKTLLEDAVSGKLKTYYYDMTGSYDTFDAIPSSELEAYMNDVMTYEFEIMDTTVKRYKTEQISIPLDYAKVKKLRFLEEWFIADGKFHKRVIAVAPYFVIEHPSIETISLVYFWILVDENKTQD
jgi:hypothetical protein